MASYGNKDTVISLTGASADGLGFRTDSELKNFIEARLAVASGYVEADRGRVFTDDAEKVLVADICERIVANYVRAMERQRNKSIVTVEGGEVEIASDEPTVITSSIKADIKRLPRSAKWHMVTSLTKTEAEDIEE